MQADALEHLRDSVEFRVKLERRRRQLARAAEDAREGLAGNAQLTILEVMESDDYFGKWFRNKSWLPWKAFLAGLYGLDMPPELEELWLQFTERPPPDEPASEAWMVVGRRGGKSRIAALLAVYMTCFRDWEPYLSPGEVATVPIISADRKSARTVMRYVKAFLSIDKLRGRIIGKPLTEQIALAPRCQIETQTGNFRAVRSYTVVTAICDEIAFWDTDEEAANPDEEVLKALLPTMASIPGALLVGLSSPYARKGVLWDRHQDYYGKNVPEVVWQASSQEMHPGSPRLDAFIAREYEKDPESAAAEYGGQFRTDVGFFVSPEAVAAVTATGRLVLEPQRGIEYVAFVDPSGGAQDSMTMAIAHQVGARAVLDYLDEVKPPFSPEEVVVRFCRTLKRYRVGTVVGDRYGGEWPRERFSLAELEKGKPADVFYKLCEESKSELYLELLAVINSKRCELLDHKVMRRQLTDLERRTSRGGRDTVDHPPKKHDDVINAAAGALCLVAAAAGWLSLDVDTPATEERDQQIREVKPMVKQLQDAIPLLKPKDEDELEYPPTCGNCIYKVQRNGAWRCKTRLFLIELNLPGCFAHELEGDGSMGTGGWSGGSE